MSERDLYRQIARATGETVSAIADMGFVLLTEQPAEPEAKAIDWDRHLAEQTVSVMPPLRHEALGSVDSRPEVQPVFPNALDSWVAVPWQNRR